MREKTWSIAPLGKGLLSLELEARRDYTSVLSFREFPLRRVAFKERMLSALVVFAVAFRRSSRDLGAERNSLWTLT
jgi:hypothetical protein